MHQTFNDLSLEIRKKSIAILSVRLSDAFDLYSQIKQAHWTIRGPGFIALHELFDKVASDVLEDVDLIAERIQQLGGTAEGTVRVSAQKSSLPEYPLEAISPKDQILALSKGISHLSRSLRKDITSTSEFNDAITADMLTEITRTMDKNLWFIESNIDHVEI